jgi:hypothetical protein
MNSEPTFWFPLKRYGWGWGLPVRWQGWVVLGAYFAAVFVGIYYFKPRGDALGLLVYLVAVTAAFIATVVLKGERPLRWRWGRQ